MTEEYYDTLTLLALDPLTAVSLLDSKGVPYATIRHSGCLVKWLERWPAAKTRLTEEGAIERVGTGQQCEYCKGWFK